MAALAAHSRFQIWKIVVVVLCSLLLELFGATAQEQEQEAPSVVITMICRDEGVNFKANLPLWLNIVDYYVFLVDSRTSDGSEDIIRSILAPADKSYFIRHYNFSGFGPARTLSLETAWEQFPQASHVLIADPDWKPEPSTMNLHDLAENYDVFRFTAFDRNGFTKRRMDWLLRHRQGLAMRYNLHEVLDIGMYNVTLIHWVVREIEKPGSWHTTVGHNNSFSADRYKFDLALLYKDLELHGHDPHTHYYLGITHEAYVNKIVPRKGLLDDEVRDHLTNATRYLELRATTQYDDEFVEQRWAVMMQLGILYSEFARDDMKAIYWLNMCKDYNPSNTECALSLVQQYLKLGQLAPAVVEMHAVLQQGREERHMMEYLNHWECRVPAMAVHLFATKAQTQGLEADEAMYFFVLWKMAHSESCPAVLVSVDPEIRSLISTAAGRPDLFERPVDFCAQPALHNYLLRNRYSVHTCASTADVQAYSSACTSFLATAPPPYEDFQVGSIAKTFYGAAILPDIIHHAFRGHSSTFLTKGRTLRFLFAEHFNAEMVYNLLGQLQRQPVADFEIVLVSPDEVLMQNIQVHISACHTAVLPGNAEKMRYHNASLLSFSSTPAGKFDYIEYNGGLSKAEDVTAELKAVHALLHDEGGAVGLTYFTRNHHVERVHRLVDARNTSFMVPFSLEATRLVNAYLAQHKLSAFKSDAELVVHMGGEWQHHANILYKPSEAHPRKQWKTYSRAEATKLVEDAGFVVASWVPSAYSHPFGEIDHYEVQKHADTGISEEDYLQKLMASFRFTQYLVKAPLTKSANSAPLRPRHGRRGLSRRIFVGSTPSGPTVASRLYVSDRVGYLGSSFAAMEQLALQRQSTTIEFAHYSLPGDTRFALIISPVIAPCLPHLSARPSIQSLHDRNRNFAARERREFNEHEAQGLLIALLAYLEKLNLIAYEFVGPPEADLSDDASAVKDAAALSGAAASQSGGARKVGGLKISMKKVQAAAAQEPAIPAGNSPANTPTDPSKLDDMAKAWKLKDPDAVSKLRAQGHSDAVIEEILRSEARREEALRSSKAAGGTQGDGVAAAAVPRKVMGMADHLRALRDQDL